MRDYIRVNQSAYNLTASEYKMRTVHCSSEPLEVIAGGSLSYLPKEEGNSILEIGPGSGEACLYFSERNNLTTAIDISPKMIANINNVSPKTKAILGNILEVNFTPETYDLVYAEKLIHLFTRSDAIRVMRKIFKCLKPGGVLFINSAIYSESKEGFGEKKSTNIPVKRFRHHYTKTEFKNLLENSNFRILDAFTTEKGEQGKYWQGYICKRPKAYWWNNLKTKTVDL